MMMTTSISVYPKRTVTLWWWWWVSLIGLLLSSTRKNHAFVCWGWEGGISSVQNLRPVTISLPSSSSSLLNNPPPPPLPRLYRSASLDTLSIPDAQSLLLDGSASLLSLSAAGNNNNSRRRRRPIITAIIDLRNVDEIQKGIQHHTEGSKLFYSSLEIMDSSHPCWGNNININNNNNNNSGSSSSSSSTSSSSHRHRRHRPRLYHIPLLEDIDGFWDEAISRMDPMTRITATLQTAVSGGALDRAAARNLEQGGCTALYTVLLASAPQAVRKALQVCTQELVTEIDSSTNNNNNEDEQEQGIILFHCQKGKDRTGVLAMLLQSCLGVSDDIIVEDYSQSSTRLVGEELVDDSITTTTNNNKNNNGLVDWSHFRGSPPIAMIDTIQWIRQRYGSIDNYCNLIGFQNKDRTQLREIIYGRKEEDEIE